MNDENKSALEEIFQIASENELKITKVDRPGYEKDIFRITIPSGDESRDVLFEGKNAQQFLETDFQNWQFLRDYEAIVDLENGRIEAIINTLEPMPILFAFRRLLANDERVNRQVERDDELEGVERSIVAEGSDGTQIEISKATNRISAMAGLLQSFRESYSLKLELGRSITFESAISALETISNAIFFQIEIQKNIAFGLTKRRTRPAQRRGDALKVGNEFDLRFPEFEYDPAPMSLYWYAKSARSMPLLQFLAYYQVVEYYFPNFEQLDSIRKARDILKNPTFRVEKDSDLTKLVNSISSRSRGGKAEREQMKITVKEVLTEEGIAQYFEANPDVAEAVSKKKSQITEKFLNLKGTPHDCRPDIAELLYDIRCKIVHTKNDSESENVEMLLPFSKEEKAMWAYIDLMKYTAQQALIKSSTTIKNY